MKKAKGLIYFLSCVLFGYICTQHWPEMKAVFTNKNLNWGLLPILISIYCISIALIALSWAECLLTFQNAPSRKRIFEVYSLSSIAKYIPGNIAQHAGRIFLLNKNGLSTKQTAFSILIEAACAGLACAFLSILGLFTFGTRWVEYGRQNAQATGLVLSLALVLISTILLSKTFRSFFVRCYQQVSPRALSILAPMLLAFILLSLNSGVIGMQLLGTESFWPCFFAFSISWLVGFVSPGAPAGLGTREIVFVFFLSGLFPTGILVSVAVATRVISVVGDLIIFLTGSLVFKEFT